MVFGRVVVVHGKISHSEPARDPRNSFHDATDVVAIELSTEPGDELGGDRTIDLRESEVELTAHCSEIVMRRFRLVIDEAA